MFRFFSILQIKLIESLDMVSGECDRNEKDLFISQLCKALYGIDCLHAHPGGGSNLRLPNETVWIKVSKSVHHSRYRCGDFKNVRISAVYDRHWQGVSREEKNSVARCIIL